MDMMIGNDPLYLVMIVFCLYFHLIGLIVNESYKLYTHLLDKRKTKKQSISMQDITNNPNNNNCQ